MIHSLYKDDDTYRGGLSSISISKHNPTTIDDEFMHEFMHILVNREVKQIFLNVICFAFVFIKLLFLYKP